MGDRSEQNQEGSESQAAVEASLCTALDVLGELRVVLRAARSDAPPDAGELLLAVERLVEAESALFSILDTLFPENDYPH